MVFASQPKLYEKDELLVQDLKKQLVEMKEMVHRMEELQDLEKLHIVELQQKQIELMFHQDQLCKLVTELQRKENENEDKNSLYSSEVCPKEEDIDSLRYFTAQVNDQEFYQKENEIEHEKLRQEEEMLKYVVKTFTAHVEYLITELYRKENEIERLKGKKLVCHAELWQKEEIASLKYVVKAFTAQLCRVKSLNDQLLEFYQKGNKIELCQKEIFKYVVKTFTAHVKYLNYQLHKL